MCSVSRTKCVVYKYVAQRSQLFAECFAVLCLFCSVTCILKKDNISVFHSCDCSLCVLADYVSVCSEFYFLSEQFGKACSHRCERHLRLRLSLRFSEVGAKDNFSAVSDQFFNRRKCCNKTVFVRNLSVFQRYIKITANKDFFALYIDIVN